MKFLYEFLYESACKAGSFLLSQYMSVVPESQEWDMIPYTAGTLVYERKNELQGCCSFSFLFHKNYIGTAWNGQEENVLLPAARSYRRYLALEILI